MSNWLLSALWSSTPSSLSADGRLLPVVEEGLFSWLAGMRDAMTCGIKVLVRLLPSKMISLVTNLLGYDAHNTNSSQSTALIVVVIHLLKVAPRGVRSAVLVRALLQLRRRLPIDGRRGPAVAAARRCRPHTVLRAAAAGGRVSAPSMEDLSGRPAGDPRT